MNRMKRRVLSLVMAFLMIISVLPTNIYATETDTQIVQTDEDKTADGSVNNTDASDVKLTDTSDETQEDTNAQDDPAVTPTVTPAVAAPVSNELEDTTSEDTDAQNDAVAQIGNDSYTTLADAVATANAVEGGATVTLLQDVKLSEQLNITGNVTIEGAYTITRDASYAGTLFNVNTAATLTLDNGLVIDGGNNWSYKEGALVLKPGGDTYMSEHVNPEEGGINAEAYLIENFGVLNINKVTIQNNYSTNEAGVVKARTDSVTTIDGALIQHIASNNCGAIVQIGRNNVTSNNATLTIKGNTRITDNMGAYNGGIIMMHSQGNTFNLEGGSIDNNYIVAAGTVFMSWCGNSNNRNTVNMSGGIITKNEAEGYGPMYIHTNSDWIMSGGEISENISYYPNYIRSNNTATITGGTIANNTLTATYAYTQIASASPLVISGGAFTQDVSRWIADGYVAIENDGVWTVRKGLKLHLTDPTTGEPATIPYIESTDMKSLIETGKAFYADYYDMRLEVLGDYELNETVIIDYPMTIDLGGNTVTTVTSTNDANETITVNPAFRILSDVTVKNGTLNSVGGEGYCFIVGSTDTAGTLTVEDGEYIGGITAISVTQGTANINDGTFKVESEKYGTTYLLNCIDSAYKAGTANIVVKGGTFHGFDPADNAAEGNGTTFTAENYVSVKDAEADIWTVSYDMSKAVAKVNDEYYTSLKEAVAAANAIEGGATVTLLQDVILSENLTISGNVIIEGDYTITRDSAYTKTLFTVNADASLEMRDIVIDGGNNWIFDKEGYDAALADASKHQDFAFVASAEGSPIATADIFTINGKTVLSGVTIQNHMGNSSCNVFGLNSNASLTLNATAIKHNATPFESTVVAMSAGSVLTINDETEISGNYAGRNGGVSRNNNGTIIMNGGSIKNNYSVNTNGTVFMLYGADSMFEMNDGEICSNSGVNGPNNGRNSAIYMHNGSKMIMNDGVICHNTGTSYGGVDAPYTSEAGNSSAVVIKGGMIVDNVSIKGNVNKDVNGGDALVISGGTYSQDVTKWLAADCGLVYDENTGYYTVVKDIAEVNGVVYNSIADAVAAANAGDTVKVLVPHKMGSTVVIDKDITLDLNGCTIYLAPEVDPAFRIQANVTVKNEGGKLDARNGVAYAFIVGTADGVKGNLTIESGIYYAETSVVSVTNGTANITGGQYAVNPYYASEGAASDYNFLLNCIDANYKTGDANIIVTGGTFYRYNPEDNKAEGADTNFLGENCFAVYDETEETWTVMDYVEQIKADLLAGKDVVLERDITVSGKYVDSIPAPTNGNGRYPNYGIFNVVGDVDVTFDLNGHTITYVGHEDAHCIVDGKEKTVNTCTIAHGLFFVNAGANFTVVDNSADATAKVLVNGLASGVYSVSPDTVITVEGGEWINKPCEICGGTNIFLYAQQGGEIYIKDGRFEQSLDSDGNSYLIVEHGGEYKNSVIDYSKTKVEITGGTFVGMNPEVAVYGIQSADNKLSWSTTDVVAENHSSVLTGENEWTVMTDIEKLRYLLNNTTDGSTVELWTDIVVTEEDILYAHGGATGFGKYDKDNPCIIYFGSEGINTTSNVNVVLDLNGHTITNNTDSYLILAMDDSKLTIMDSDPESKGTIDVSTMPAVWSTGTNTLVTINGGKFVTDSTDGVLWSTHAGDLVINGGEFSTTADNASLLIVRNTKKFDKPKYNLEGTATITVYGGTFHGFDPENMADDNTNPFTYFNAVAEGYMSYLIDADTYVVIPKNTYVAINVEDQEFFTTVAAGLEKADAGETVKVITDVTGEIAEKLLVVYDGITLDLNGYQLEAGHLVGFNGSNVIDSTTDKAGRLNVAPDNMVLAADNKQMPVLDGDNGYLFLSVNMQTQLNAFDGDTIKITYKPSFGKAFNTVYFADGAEDNDIQIKIRLTWDNYKEDGTLNAACSQDFVYSEEMVTDVYGNGRAFTFGGNGLSTCKNIKVYAVVESDSGVECVREIVLAN